MKLTPLISGLIVLGIAGGMVATNPNRESYQNYAATEMNTRLKKEVCSDLSGDFVKSQCESFLDMTKERMRGIVANSTQRQNYFLFSIYETEFNFSPIPKVKSYQFTTVGVFNNFWTFEAKEQQQ